MFTENQLKIFISLFCLTFIIFFSSTILVEHASIGSEVQAKSTGASFKSHRGKSFHLLMKDAEVLTNEVVVRESKWPVFLTFDDGPTEYTTNILDILAHYQIKSTFFMLDGNIRKYPNIVKAVVNDGHSVGCHGVTHRVSHFYKTTTSPLGEMKTCRQSLTEISGEDTPLIRVPFGSYPHLTKEQKLKLDEAELIMWDWNVDSSDWELRSRNLIIETVIKQVQKMKEKGKTPVVLFHDKEITAAALPTIIVSLHHLGYEFKPITQYDEPLQFNQKK